MTKRGTGTERPVPLFHAADPYASIELIIPLVVVEITARRDDILMHERDDFHIR